MVSHARDEPKGGRRGDASPDGARAPLVPNIAGAPFVPNTGGAPFLPGPNCCSTKYPVPNAARTHANTRQINLDMNHPMILDCMLDVPSQHEIGGRTFRVTTDGIEDEDGVLLDVDNFERTAQNLLSHLEQELADTLEFRTRFNRDKMADMGRLIRVKMKTLLYMLHHSRSCNRNKLSACHDV